MDAVVYAPTCLATFMAHVLNRHTPPTLVIVGSDQATFIENLRHSIETTQREKQEDVPSTKHPLLKRTLRVLAQSRTVRLAFCPSVEVLRAYLSTLPNDLFEASRPSGAARPTLQSSGSIPEPPSLLILNAVSLYRDTGLFSAQGISETLAGAVEAAVRSRVRLVIIETIDQLSRSRHHQTEGNEQIEEPPTNQESSEQEENRQSSARRGGIISSPWDEQIPILSSTTKLFGRDADRSVMQSAVTVGDVVKRWCRFEQLALD